MERFRIARALLQSAPPEAASLWGDERLRDVGKAHPDRFWISQYVDPRAPDAIERLRAIAKGKTRVVKLLPPVGYRPDDPAFDGFWETMQDLGLAVMAHTGFITARHKAEEAGAGVFLSSTHADPLFFDRPARKFPRLNIILCHLGGGIWHEAAAHMVTEHDNVWGDVAGFGLFALKRLMMSGAAVDWSKLFWGNDSPPSAYPFNLRLHLAALRQAGAEKLAGLLLYENGRRFGGRFLG
jgi:predicted TIM-barrel fold metal-dependent hydrolase